MTYSVLKVPLNRNQPTNHLASFSALILVGGACDVWKPWMKWPVMCTVGR